MDTNLLFRSPRIGLLKELSTSIEYPSLSASLPPCAAVLPEESGGACRTLGVSLEFGDDSVFTDECDSSQSSPRLSSIRRSFSTDTGLSEITTVPGPNKVVDELCLIIMSCHIRDRS